MMYNGGLTTLCGFVLLFAFFLELLNMEKCFPVKKKRIFKPHECGKKLKK